MGDSVFYEFSGYTIVMEAIINELKWLGGEALFEATTQLLYKHFGATDVFIGYFVDGNTSIQTLSYRHRGEISDNFRYPLDGTPCSDVRCLNQICCYSANIQALFPRDTALKDLQAEAYVGIPVYAKKSTPEGIIVCLFDKPFELPDELVAVCQSLSYYLGVEMQYSALLERQDQLLWALEEGQRVAKVGSWVWNLNQESFRWSKEVYRIYGLPDETLEPSLTLLETLIHPEDRDWVLNALHSAIASESHSYNLVHRTLLEDGQIKYLRKRAEVIRNEFGAPVQMRGTVHDVTDVYQISAKLTKTSRQLNTAFTYVEEGIWEYDIEKREFATSPKFWQILGREKPTCGNDLDIWLDSIVDEDKEEGLTFFNSFLQQRHTSVFQFEFRRKQHLAFGESVSKEHWLKIKGSVIAKDDAGNPVKIAGIQRDITSSVETKRQLSRAKVVFDNTSECILITDKQNRIISVNRALEETTGYREHEILGLRPNVLSSGIHDKSYYESLWKHLSEYGHWKGEVWNKRKNGEIYPEEMSINVIRDDNQEVINYVAVFRDISHWKKAEEQLSFYAYNDPLTGLVNRRSFAHRVSKHIDQVSNRHTQAFALLFIDTDDFKSINDLYGHDFGDNVLVHIANCLKGIFANHDDICRYGGDEFCVLLPDTTAAEARQWGQEVVNRISQTFMIDGVEVNTTVSVGISSYPESGETHSELLKNADYAMYNMKGNGRNGICEYDSNMQSQYIEKLKLRDRLKKAITENALTVHYQPIIDADSGKIKRFEALLRWFDDVEGFISPEKFIPVAEKYGLIAHLGEYVLHQACRDLCKVHQAGYTDIAFNINRSVKEFMNYQATPMVWDVIEKYGLTPDSVIIEITETTASSESQNIQALLGEFKQRGIKVALDDFGTGYSSLSSVVELRPDIIKIDRSFIREMEQSQDSRTLVSLIIDLSHKLGIQVVAEGVENRAQLECLQELNCHYVQGFYYSPARPLTDCLVMLNNQYEEGLEDDRSHDLYDAQQEEI